MKQSPDRAIELLQSQSSILDKKDQNFGIDEERILLKPLSASFNVNQGAHSSRNSKVSTLLTDGMKPAYQISFIGVALLFISIVSSASILPFTVILPLNNPLMKTCWRNSCTLVFLYLILAGSLLSKREKLDFRMIAQDRTLCYNILGCAISFNFMQTTYLLAGQYTIISHACMFSNLGAALIVIHRFIKR